MGVLTTPVAKIFGAIFNMIQNVFGVDSRVCNHGVPTCQASIQLYTGVYFFRSLKTADKLKYAEMAK